MRLPGFLLILKKALIMHPLYRLCLLISLLFWAAGCDADARVCQADLDCFLGESCQAGQCKDAKDATLLLPDMASATNTSCRFSRPTRCGDTCVDTRSDQDACGGCGRQCDEGQLCTQGECINRCVSRDDCPPGGVCDPDSGTCTLDCGERAKLCAGKCSPCPPGNGSEYECEEDRCVAIGDDGCEPGTKMCSGACLQCPQGDGITSTQCGEDSCVAASCIQGFTLCKEGCCPEARMGPTTGPIDRSDRPTGFYTQLRIGPDGFPVIGYISNARGDVRVARWDGQQWQSKVASDADGATSLSMDLDERGRAHMAYRSGISERLMILEPRDDATWRAHALSTKRAVDSGAVLRLDDNDVPHVVYGTQSGLYHVWGSNFIEQEEEIDIFGGEEGDYDVAIGPDQTIYVLYIKKGELYLASKRPGSPIWTKKPTLLQVRASLRYVSLEFGAQGPLHAMYQGSLYSYYAKLSQDASSSPTGEQITNTREGAGIKASMAVDAAGNVHICFTSDFEGRLFYAIRRTEVGWRDEVVDESGVNDAGRFGQHCSIDVDSESTPHISYYGGGKGDLRYTRKQGGVWLD